MGLRTKCSIYYYNYNIRGGDTIAKDGTCRGGRIVKSGGKGQPAAEKIEI
ncbi:hypothetical protein ANHYDRO_01018 [Anaerococcus hydrogenalis DSM 7454]|uniref:Uncharacterized protein n=1 Tax=Anaerococcus hydrogenalis DSM 7454 TaxID=561177 RepID=B6W8W7_9FIRM|nr:hypothetical protein ANHYDRO_01018 [Anaerococcus hydrogenalis DSM 7454]